MPRTTRMVLLTTCLWMVSAVGAQTAAPTPPLALKLPAAARPVTDPGQLRAAAAQLSGLAQASGLKGPCQDSHLARFMREQDSGLEAIETVFTHAGYVMIPLREGADNQLSFTLTRGGLTLMGLLTFDATETRLAWCRLPLPAIRPPRPR